MSEHQDREFVSMSNSLKNSVEFFTKQLSDPEILKNLSQEAIDQITDNVGTMAKILIPIGMTLARGSR